MDRYLSIQDRDDQGQLVALYGVRRTNTGFRKTADWFHARYAREKPLLSSLFDLNRYGTASPVNNKHCKRTPLCLPMTRQSLTRYS